MPFDVQGALKEGYTYDDIANYLSSKVGFDLQGALKEGHSAEEIVSYLTREGGSLNPIKAGPAYSGDLHNPEMQEIVESSANPIIRGVNNAFAAIGETMKPVGYAFGVSGELKQGIDKLRQPSKIYEEMGYTDIVGKLGDAVPYMIGGGIVGTGKRALGTLAKNIIADATVSTARNIDNPKGVAENVVVDVVGNAAFTGLGQSGKAVYKYLKGIDVSKLTENEVEQLAKKMAQDLNLTIDEAKDVVSNAKLRVEKSGGEIVFDPENVGKKADDYLANKVKEAAQEQIAATKDFGISLSKGQATKSLAQQKFEVEALNGAYGEKAQKIMQEFVNAQNRQIKAVAENIKRTLGDEGIDTYTAGNIIKDKTKELYEQMSKAVDEAYGKVDFNKASVDKKFFDDLHNNIMSLHNVGEITVDKELTPNTTWALSQIKDIAEKFKNSEGEIPLRDIEILRRRINSALDNNVSKADKRALMAVKSQFDSTLDDFVDNQLLSGDVNVIEQLKVARKKRGEMGKVFDFGAKDSGRKLLSEIINNDITPEHLSNYILGKGQLVGNSKSSVEALRFLKSTFGESSAEWKAIKAAGFSRILEAAQNGEYLKAAKLAKQIQQNLLNNRSVMSELYTKDELATLGKFANAVAATVPDERAFNPSRTAYSIASIVRNYAKSGLLNNPLVKSMSEGIANAKYENLAKKSINYKVPNTNLKGGLRVPFLIALSGGTTGGAYGFSQGDTLGERIGNAAKYGALGAAAGYGLVKLLKGEKMPAGLSIDAYHGSPYNFDKFDSKKLLSGEGANAYGRGFYFTDSPKIAEHYRVNLAVNKGEDLGNVKFKGKTIMDWYDYIDRTARTQDDYDKLALLEELEITYNPERVLETANEIGISKKAIDWFKRTFTNASTPGYLYKVRLSPDKYQLLDLDKPIKEQKYINDKLKEMFGDEIDENMKGIEIYSKLSDKYNGDESKLAADLRKRGVYGLSYKANDFGHNANSNNYVIFDENDIEILEKSKKTVGEIR